MKQPYIGNELELFKYATSWKKYWSDMIIAYLGKKVLEVGAGMGSTTRVLLAKTDVEKWLCIEPDPALASCIAEDIQTGVLSNRCQILNESLETVFIDEKFDSILYIDVLEHIKDDTNELIQAERLLKKGGYLIIVVPAYNFLYSEFDKAIGHYRRYTKNKLLSILPENIQPVQGLYLDSVGVIVSLANKFLLHQPYPTAKQIKFWDKRLVSLSKITDKLLFYSMGRSLLFVGRKM